jgi:ubiquinone/menaquinone biosynthesis C-methylase UbiE
VGLYARYVLPRLIHLACSGRPTERQREKVVPGASGRVLEVGIGSGLNLAFYDAGKVRKLWGLEPSPEMVSMARAAAASVGFEVEFIGLPGEEIPLDDASVDTVVVTYTLCSIPEPEVALRQMARVLKPGGRLLFCEHGKAPDEGVRRWQERVNPIWRRFSGGCNLNRPIPELIEQGGFQIERLETMYLPGWRPGTFNYWGAAVGV